MKQTEIPQTKQSSPGFSRVLAWLVILVLIGGGAWLGRDHIPPSWLSFLQGKAQSATGAKAGSQDAKGGKDGGRGGASSRPTPVVVATARKGDLPRYLNGLGTVTALNTVSVHTRVDGELQKVYFTEGQMVKEGDALAEIDPRPFQVLLTQAQGQFARDKATLDNARRDLERYRSARDAVTQQQIDTAASTVAQYEAATKIDQGQIDSALLQITYSHVTSPVTGRVGLRILDKGNIVHAADANGLTVITQVQPITVVFNLPEANVPQILKGNTGETKLAVEAWDRDMKTRLATGTLLAVDSQIDPTTASIKCRALFENKDEALFPNQFVNVRLLVETRKDAVLVPLASLQHSPKTDFVYIVKQDQTIEMRPVKIGVSEAEQLIIEDGVQAGETLITEGVDKLQPGMKVTTPQAGDAPAAVAHEGKRPPHGKD
jgi:membrane fusion protein, multidrug efflux system